MDRRSKEAYSYVPFDNCGQIRLLRLGEYSDLNKSVHELKTFALDALPLFTALSYTWGDPSPFARLWLQAGGYLNIAQSLAGFLATFSNLRHGFDEPIEFIWIDAICIDQDNIEEKNSQIPLMQEIYQKAVRVLIWLGLTSEDSSLAASFIPIIATVFVKLDEKTRNTPQLLQRQPEIPPDTDPRWLAVLQLLCRPWFERIWVQQEVILASSVVMACGNDWMSWDELTSFIAIIYNHRLHYLFGTGLERDSIFRNRINIIRYIQYFRQTYRFSKMPRLVDNLNELTMCKASDPRDKIYGLLGISTLAYYPTPDGERRCEIRVDYKISVEALYTEFARSSLISGQSTQILHFAQVMGLSCRSRDFPSWVPDWVMHSGLSHFYDWAADAGYKASGDSQAHFRGSADGKEIYVEGLKIDEICMASAIPAAEDFPKTTWQTEDPLRYRKILDWIVAVEEQGGSLGSYINGQTWFEACWRTLIGNMLSDGQPMPVDWDLSECKMLKELLIEGIKGGAAYDAFSRRWGGEE